MVHGSAKLHEVAKLINRLGKDALVMSKVCLRVLAPRPSPLGYFLILIYTQWLSRRYGEENVSSAFSWIPSSGTTTVSIVPIYTG